MGTGDPPADGVALGLATGVAGEEGSLEAIGEGVLEPAGVGDALGATGDGVASAAASERADKRIKG